MQLKNSSPVAMEKRMDLASLFCMIGRHGPAVAVAVIAMVSVLAGFIIYRNVKGKRRKAEAADDDSKSPGKVLQPEESRNSVESTDVSDGELSIEADAGATRSLLKIRNRRATAEKSSLPKKDCEPEDQWLKSLVQDSSSASAADGVDVAGDVCRHGTDDLMKAVKEDHFGCLKPAVICESHEEKVLKSEREEKVVEEEEVVTTEDGVLGQKMGHERENLPSALDGSACSEQIALSQSQDDGLEDKETKCMESNVEELISHTNAEMKEDHTENSDFSKEDANLPLSEKEIKNEVQEECIDDQLAALQQELVLSLSKETCLPSPVQDNSETVIGDMPSIQDGNGQKLEPRNDPTFDLEVCVEKEPLPSSCDEAHNCPSIGLGHAQPSLNQSVELDLINDALCDPTSDVKDEVFRELQPKHEVKDEMGPDLAQDAILDGLCPDVPPLQNIQSENNEAAPAVTPTEENVEHFVSSSIGDLNAAVCEKASLTADVTSTEIPYPEASVSFQDQKSDQMRNLCLPEVTTDPAPDITESINPPFCQIPSLSYDKVELTWSSAGTGEESGISSMTVSPALQEADIECDITPENVADLIMAHCPGSEEETRAQVQFFADDTAISVNKDAAAAVSGSSSHVSQEYYSEQMVGDEPSTVSKDIDSNENDYHGGMSQCAVQLSELKETDVKVEFVESKKAGEKTEISIMAATMDNNEWLTDGNYQVLPWMNLPIQSLTQNTQTDPLSSKDHHSLLPVDAANPPSTEVEQTILPRVNENIENDKKVVAVPPMPQNVNVTFRTHYLIQSPYQKVAITGNKQELGNWKEFIPLERAKDGHWYTVVSLPAESHVEWKFVVLDKGGVCRWEECGNRLLETGYGDDLLVHKWWGFL